MKDRESNPGHIGGRPAWETNAQPLRHPCSLKRTGLSHLILIVLFLMKASVTLLRDEANEETIRKARIKSEMLVALETCRQLHKAEELDEELQPKFR